jgi:DNA replication and repair protein RecF
MAGIISADIKAVRNLLEISFEGHPGFNVFYGVNGSGKTSILEAIYLLSSGKSFRHHHTQAIIHNTQSALSVFGWILTENGLKRPAGIEKTKEGKTQIRLDGESISSTAPLAECLPLQIIHPESDILITGSPKWRRQFLDWGLFHVEPSFFNAWQRLQKVTKQRNAVLKQTQDKMQVSSWDAEYVQFSDIVSNYRKTYVFEFQTYFQEMMRFFLPHKKLVLSYLRGWPENVNLLDVLSKNFFRDIQLGYTFYGPQRDDLGVYYENSPASEVLSRGEQKLAVTALRLAQGRFLKEKTQKKCIYLLDDFAAELDTLHRRQVVETLSHLQSQIFLTTINYEEVKESLKDISLSLFHVEQGTVKTV